MTAIIVVGALAALAGYAIGRVMRTGAEHMKNHPVWVAQGRIAELRALSDSATEWPA
jgi:hypothetical protein